MLYNMFEFVYILYSNLGLYHSQLYRSGVKCADIGNYLL